MVSVVKREKVVDNYDISSNDISVQTFIEQIQISFWTGQNNIARFLGGAAYKIPNPDKHDKSFDENYWNDNKKAYYIHHFVTQLGYPNLD